MSLEIHELRGCAPAPLAQYLKALGILRLLAEQGGDPDARGWWQNERFCLLTSLTREGLERFFLERYQPTPLLSPWIASSSLLRKTDPLPAMFEKSPAVRFAPMREGIFAARQLLDEQSYADAIFRAITARTKTDKTYQSDLQRELLGTSETFLACLRELRTQASRSDLSECRQAELTAAIATVESMVVAAPPPTRQESDVLKASEGYNWLKKAAERRYRILKDDLLSACRKHWRGGLAQWFAAAVALDGDGAAKWPSLLGNRGGNVGHLDLPNNFMQSLGDLFVVNAPDAPPTLGASELLAHALWDAATTRMGDAKVGQFYPGSAGGANTSTGSTGNGLVNPWDFVLMMEGTVLFRVQATRRLDPNAFSRASAPFAVRSHAAGYGSAGNEKAERGEQWLPLWDQPATLGEVTALFGEARVQLGRWTAGRPVEVARAISRLGVARGVRSFVRYGYLERNGQSTFAVPLGRMDVHEVRHARLIDDLAGWMDRLQRLARGKSAPARLIHAERQLADAVMSVLMHDATPERWQAVLLAAVAIEHLQTAGCAIEAGPVPSLQAEWAAAAGNTAEVRLALALGSVKSVRHHWLPLEKGAWKFKVSDKRLAKDPRVVMTGRDALADLAALVERRLVEASDRSLPMRAEAGCGARLGDIARLLNGDVDLDRVLDLARAFMALKECKPPARDGQDEGEWPPDAWLALRLAFLPWPLLADRQIPADVATLRRLQSGDIAGAVAAALARLRSFGIRPPLQAGITDKRSARLWAAALAFPIDKKTARAVMCSLDPNQKGLRNA
ncbi:MAG TPA: type I-U CRISPR-associated protein Csx17 [Bryobacteraceae bacterium]|nr:type I-U CRISPR-associated protein Csx17 [Bryobacteraceae bacterium]